MRRPHRSVLCALALLAPLAFGACSSDDGSGGEGPDRGESDTGRVDTGEVDSGGEADTGGGTDDTGGGTDDTGGGGEDVVEDAPESCEPGERLCLSSAVQAECADDGVTLIETPCVEGTVCARDDVGCQPTVCEPRTRECVDDQNYRRCDDGTYWSEPIACDEDRYCDEGRCLARECLPNVMFLIDGSGSMAGEWDNVRRSIDSVVTSNPEVAYGLSMFPTGLSCTIGDGGTDLFGGGGVDWPHVGIDVNAGPVLADWFANNDASGGSTPLISAMNWFADNARDIWGTPIRFASLIVMTEGLDTCSCDEDSIGCMTSGLAAATQRLAVQGVHVYVIGYQFGEAPEALNAIAENGNTAFTEFIFAGNESSLTDAFGTIIEDVKGCN